MTTAPATATDIAETIRRNTRPVMATVTNDGIDHAAPGEGEVKGGHPIALIPDGMDIKSLKPLIDEWRTAPERRRGTTTTDRVQSFIDLTNRFSDENSALFARGAIDPDTNDITATLTAILDYHPAAPESTPDNARFCDHRIKYAFPVSREMATWCGQNRKKMAQPDFAAFIENNIADISTAPDKFTVPGFDALCPKFANPSDMVNLSRGLEITTKETVKGYTRLSSGETEIQYVSEHKNTNGKPLKLPDFFLIQIPIFNGGAVYRVPVRLRFRVADGAVTWWFDIYRIDLAFEQAFTESCGAAQTMTKLPLFYGSV